MIRLTCAACGSRLSARDDLAGQTKKCPKCRAPLLIPQAALSSADRAAQPADQTYLPLLDLPERLCRQHRYLICDKSKVVAAWENNGQGWMLRTKSGMVSAARNHQLLPNEGDFKLVELQMAASPDGLRLRGIVPFQLALRWALTTLEKGDDAIVAKITGLGALNREQKDAVRQAIKDQFMREVWHDAAHVFAYLANPDYHSPGTAETELEPP